MAAGETENPRKVMPRAYNAVFYRLTTFFVLGSLAVGINVPFNDAEYETPMYELHVRHTLTSYTVI
jgi:amino acid permease